MAIGAMVQRGKYLSLTIGCGERCQFCCLLFCLDHLFCTTPSPSLVGLTMKAASVEQKGTSQRSGNSIKGRTVSRIWNSHTGALCWSESSQGQQGNRRNFIPLVFLRDNLCSDKTRCLQRSTLLPSHGAGVHLRARRVEVGRTGRICKFNKQRNNVNGCYCCFSRWVCFLLFLLHPVKSCKKVRSFYWNLDFPERKWCP